MLPVNTGSAKDLISIPRGDPRLFDTLVFERQIWKDEAWLVHQGIEKLVDVF